MKEKKNSLFKYFVIIGIIEIILVILSGNFTRKLEFGFTEGKFVIRHKAIHTDLQDKISEEFQKDEFVQDAAIIHAYDISNKAEFIKIFRDHKNPVIKKLWGKFSDEVKEIINTYSGEIDKHKLNLITHNIQGIIQEDILYEDSLEQLLLKSRHKQSLKDDPELSDLISSYHQALSSDAISMTEREKLRLNRLLLQAEISEDVLEHQEIEPKLYGSYKLYRTFADIFGEPHAFSAFYLLRILLILDITLLFLAFATKKLLFDRPSKPQIVFEMIYSLFEDFVRDTLGKERLHFTPYIVTLFLFIWTSNIIGMIPIPGFMEPTRNLNVPLGMGLMAVIIVHITAIKVKGVWGHFSNFVNPIKNPLFLLDIVGEFSKIVSISFRLFGNILGGAIIILVVSSLVKFIVFPVGLNLFFGLFVGTIQAFVFTMLALTYIGVEVSE